MPCIFCDEQRRVCLHSHHVRPKFWMDGFGGRSHFTEREAGESVEICGNCHAILHQVLYEPLEKDLQRMAFSEKKGSR